MPRRGGTKKMRLLNGRFVPSNLSSEGRISRQRQAANNPWIDYIRRWAHSYNLTYSEALGTYGEAISEDYHNGVVPDPKIPKVVTGRIPATVYTGGVRYY